MEQRGQMYFVKLVVRHVPRHFLHQRAVYSLIKESYPEGVLSRSQSGSGNGFSITSSRQFITLEVFGDELEGGMAGDLTVKARNITLARERMNRFLEFYALLYNLMEVRPLGFRPMQHSRLPGEEH